MAALLVLTCGTSLRSWGLSRSLWLDEAWVANSMAAQPLQQVFYYDRWLQSSPPLFLLAGRGLVALFGLSNFTLRLLPWLCGIAAPIVFWFAARRQLSPWFAALATSLVAFSPAAIELAGEVKQYSVELLVASVLLLLALRYADRSTGGRFAALVGATLLGLLLAYSVSMLVPALVLLLILTPLEGEQRRYRRFVRAALLGGMASALFAAEYFLLIVPNRTQELSDVWFRLFVGHPALDTAVSVIGQLLPLPGRFVNSPLNLVAGFAVLACCAMAAALGKPDTAGRLWPVIQVYCLAPLICVVAASYARVYPYSTRTALFVLPGLALALAVQLETAASFLAKREPRRLAPAVAVVLAGIIGAGTFKQLRADNSERREDVAHAYSYLLNQTSPADLIWVHASCSESFRLYSRMLGEPKAPVHFGNTGWPCCARGVANTPAASPEEARLSVRADLDAGMPPAFNGRIWLLYTTRHGHWWYVRYNEIPLMKDYLTDRGCHAAGDRQFLNIGLSLFDCSAPHRLTP